MDSSPTMSKLLKGTFVELSTVLKSLHCQGFLIVGLVTMYLVNKIQCRLNLFFEHFDLVNFQFEIQNFHLTPLPFFLLLMCIETGRSFVFYSIENLHFWRHWRFYKFSVNCQNGPLLRYVAGFFELKRLPIFKTIVWKMSNSVIIGHVWLSVFRIWDNVVDKLLWLFTVEISQIFEFRLAWPKLTWLIYQAFEYRTKL